MSAIIPAAFRRRGPSKEAVVALRLVLQLERAVPARRMTTDGLFRRNLR
jgi:hypothetical protein